MLQSRQLVAGWWLMADAAIPKVARKRGREGGHRQLVCQLRPPVPQLPLHGGDRHGRQAAGDHTVKVVQVGRHVQGQAMRAAGRGGRGGGRAYGVCGEGGGAGM